MHKENENSYTFKLYTRGALRANLLKILATKLHEGAPRCEDIRRTVIGHLSLVIGRALKNGHW